MRGREGFDVDEHPQGTAADAGSIPAGSTKPPVGPAAWLADAYDTRVSQAGNMPASGNHPAQLEGEREHVWRMDAAAHTLQVPPAPRAGRYFESGAYRDSVDEKFDYEGFLSPLVLEAYGAYMHKHRRQSDGEMRDSDNWQRGIPREQYMKSAWRHFMDLWSAHRGYPSRDGLDEALGGLLFNVMGYWHECLKEDEGW